MMTQPLRENYATLSTQTYNSLASTARLPGGELLDVGGGGVLHLHLEAHVARRHFEEENPRRDFCGQLLLLLGILLLLFRARGRLGRDRHGLGPAIALVQVELCV